MIRSSDDHGNGAIESRADERRKRRRQNPQTLYNRELCHLPWKSIKGWLAVGVVVAVAVAVVKAKAVQRRVQSPRMARTRTLLFALRLPTAHSFWLNFGDLRPVCWTRRRNLGYYKELRLAAGDPGGGGGLWVLISRPKVGYFFYDGYGPPEWKKKEKNTTKQKPPFANKFSRTKIGQRVL